MANADDIGDLAEWETDMEESDFTASSANPGDSNIKATLDATLDTAAKPSGARFQNYSDHDLDSFRLAQHNISTARKTLAHVNVLNEFLKIKGETRALHTIQPPELDALLGNFFVSVRKPNGENYEPCYLKNIQNSIERHLKNRGYEQSLTRDRAFHNSRELLRAKQIELKKLGRGNRPQAANPLTDQEVNALWERGALGSGDPETLLRTLWWINTTQFGMRAGHKEHLAMKWGDIELKQTTEGREYLEKTIERQTKTRPGSDPENVRQIRPTAFATNDERCPVSLYKLFQNNRPSDMSKPDSPFYLGTMQKPKSGQIWFRRQNLGPNKLQTFMHKMTEIAGIDSPHLTNSSARKYLVQTLNDKNVPPTHIQQITGHKNVQSVNRYSKLNTEQKELYSLTLSRPDSIFKRPASNAIGAPPDQSLVNPNSMKCSSSTATSKTLPYPTAPLNLFCGATITGGSINITIKQSSPNVKQIQSVTTDTQLSLTGNTAHDDTVVNPQ